METFEYGDLFILNAVFRKALGGGVSSVMKRELTLLSAGEGLTLHNARHGHTRHECMRDGRT